MGISWFLPVSPGECSGGSSLFPTHPHTHHPHTPYLHPHKLHLPISFIFADIHAKFQQSVLLLTLSRTSGSTSVILCFTARASARDGGNDRDSLIDQTVINSMAFPSDLPFPVSSVLVFTLWFRQMYGKYNPAVCNKVDSIHALWKRTGLDVVVIMALWCWYYLRALLLLYVRGVTFLIGHHLQHGKFTRLVLYSIYLGIVCFSLFGTFEAPHTVSFAEKATCKLPWFPKRKEDSRIAVVCVNRTFSKKNSFMLFWHCNPASPFLSILDRQCVYIYIISRSFLWKRSPSSHITTKTPQVPTIFPILPTGGMFCFSTLPPLHHPHRVFIMALTFRSLSQTGLASKLLPSSGYARTPLVVLAPWDCSMCIAGVNLWAFHICMLF